MRISLQLRDGFEGSGLLSDLGVDCGGSNCCVDDMLRPSGKREVELEGVIEILESNAVEGDDVVDCVTGLASRVVVKRDGIKML